MTIKQLGGVFGRNPTFNDVTIEGTLTFDGDIDINSDLKVDGTIEADNLILPNSGSELGIGTATPGQKLEVKESSAGTGDAIIRLRGNGNNADNTPLGSLEWFNADASGAQPGVVAAVEAQSANSNGHMGKLLFKTHDGSGSEADPPTTRMTIDQSGLVGIGTDSPSDLVNLYASSGGATLKIESNTANAYDSSKLELLGGNLSTSEILMGDASAADVGKIIYRHDGNSLAFNVNTSERLRIDSSGKVGIGTDSPTGLLHISSSAPAFYMTDTTNNTEGVISMDNAGSLVFNADLNNEAGSSNIRFAVDGSEAMRIDSSQNVLVGTTDTDTQNNNAGSSADNGFVYNRGSGGYFNVARYNGTVAYFNRTSTDGDILDFRKSGASIASIGVVNSDNLRIGGVVADHAGLQFGTNILIPETAGTASDGLVDIGTGANRYQDVYATNGTIQTSDGNEKQDIEALSDAEQRVAVAAKGLLRKFRWKSSVEAKGDEARTHFGIIAQDLQAAFAAEGLDAGDYGMFINSTWTDEETGEERSRMGVRYSELLAFIISAI